MPETWLLGGDANNDKDINLFDLVLVAAAFNTCAGDPAYDTTPEADINETGCVDLFDLVLVGVNYGMTGPTGWPAPDPPLATSAASDYQPAMRQPRRRPPTRQPTASTCGWRTLTTCTASN